MCSLQESSAVSPHIWLGMDKWSDGQPVGLWDDEAGITISSRMHLNVQQVQALLPQLKYFVQHGNLPGDKDQPDADHTLTHDERRLVEAYRNRDIETVVHIAVLRDAE